MYQKRYDRACDRIGAITGSRTARDLALGRIDPDLAELIAFNAASPHEHTDYGRLIATTEDRDHARSEMAADPIPVSSPSYLE